MVEPKRAASKNYQCLWRRTVSIRRQERGLVWHMRLHISGYPGGGVIGGIRGRIDFAASA